MSNVKITIGGALEREASRRFIDAWHRAESGETFHQRDLAFESWDALVRVLTGKPVELLRYVRGHKVTNVEALTAAGLLHATDSRVRADCDAIETTIAI